MSNQAEIQAEALTKEVASRLDNIVRIVKDKSQRYECASAEGAELAAQVRLYLTDPEGYGTKTLDVALARFMSMHAGGFWVTPVAASEAS